MPSVIPDFFFEFISRIIPGLVVIALCLYWSDSNLKVIFSNIESSFFVLVASWIIGTTLDLGVFLIVKRICPKCLLDKTKTTDLDIWKKLCELNSWQREYYFKTQAVCIFFRGMASISALSVCLIFIITSSHLKMDSVLPALLRHPWVYGILGVIFSIVFVWCWWAENGALHEWSKRFATNQKKDAV